jgi:nucleoside transporter
MKTSLYVRFSIMMFLQYMVWGAWAAILPNFLKAATADGGLGFTASQIGWIIGMAAGIGAITAPFIAGQIADRYFSTQRFMAVLLLCAGIIKWYTAYQTTYGMWMMLSVIFSILYLPTLSLVNSVSFSHIPDSQKYFPLIRVWGTIGFIAGMWAFPMIYLQTDLKFQILPPFLAGPQVENATALLGKSLEFAGIVMIIYAIYCLTLPNTPPKRDAVEKLAFAKAFGMLKIKRSFAVLILITVPIAILHYTYWMQVGPFLAHLGIKVKNIPACVSVGQFSEIIVMAGLGLVLKRLGSRWVISIGCLAYGVRFLIFAMFGALPPWLIVASQALHGICAAAFFAASFIYVDRICDADIRHSAQTVFSIILFGIGPILAGKFFPIFEGISTTAGGELNFVTFWLVLGVIGIITTALFALLFRDETRGAES